MRWEQMTGPCPVDPGTRLELLSMCNDPDPVLPGTRGTVTGGNGGQIWVDWDNGRRLTLLVGVDRWQVIA